MSALLFCCEFGKFIAAQCAIRTKQSDFGAATQRNNYTCLLFRLLVTPVYLTSDARLEKGHWRLFWVLAPTAEHSESPQVRKFGELRKARTNTNWLRARDGSN